MNDHDEVTIAEDVTEAYRELDYEELRPYGLDAQQTYFAIWCSMPKAHRYPSTQNELARQLGVAAGLMTKWKTKPGFHEAVWHLQRTWIRTERFADIAENMCNLAEGNGSQAVAAARFVADVFGYNHAPSVQVNTQVNVDSYTEEFESPRQKLEAMLDDIQRIRRTARTLQTADEQPDAV
jgi:hypothetical protein